MAEPSKQLRLQWARNEVIDYLRLVSSFEEQKAYESNVPIAHVPIEIIVQWEDATSSALRDWRTEYTAPVFTPAEITAMDQFERTWKEVASAVDYRRLRISQLVETAPWKTLRAAAEEALAVFMVRGKLPQDVEADL